MHGRPVPVAPGPAAPPSATAGPVAVSSIADVAAQWDALCDVVDAPPWLRPGWFDAWWASFGTGTLGIFVVREAERVVGVAPMARRGRLLASLTNYHTPAWGIVARDQAARDDIATAVMRTGTRRVSFQFVPTSGADLVTLRAAAGSSGRLVLTRVLERCPFVDTSVGWLAFEASLRGHFRRELRRRARALAAMGTVELEVRAGIEGLEAALQEGFAVEAAAWKGARGTAIASRAQTERFYRAVAHWAASNGWLRLGFLRLDGRAVAFDYALEAGGVHALLKTGYDPELRQLAPGMLLRQRMLRRAFESGIVQYQFLGHDDPWKREWTRAADEQVLVQAFSRTPAGVTDWVAHRWGRPLARRVLRR